MSFLDNILKGLRVERSFASLTEDADKLDSLANTLEGIVTTALTVVDDASEYAAEVINNLRDNAEKFRAEAATKANDLYDDVRSDTQERDRKVAFIRQALTNGGITSDRWFNDSYVNTVSDEVVNYTYKIFGGK